MNPDELTSAPPPIFCFFLLSTIDGYGSYPESTQKSATLSTIGAVSRRFYLLFQHHTTPALVPHHGFFSSGVGENILTSLGPSTSILVLDARSERSKNVVCSEQTYDLAFMKMYQEIPQGTRHLLVQIGVPIAYPRLVFAENLMGSVGNVLGNIAGAKNVVNKLNGEPELLDDLNDHWTGKHITHFSLVFAVLVECRRVPIAMST